MTPEEKAFALVEKFIEQLLDVGLCEYDVIDDAKRCAEIAIDEILEWDCNERGTVDESVEYWNDVKAEVLSY